jgi:hypothetical protein
MLAVSVNDDPVVELVVPTPVVAVEFPPPVVEVVSGFSFFAARFLSTVTDVSNLQEARTRVAKIIKRRLNIGDISNDGFCPSHQGHR